MILSFELSSPLSMISLLMMPSMTTESLLAPRFMVDLPVRLESESTLMNACPGLASMTDESATAFEKLMIVSAGLLPSVNLIKAPKDSILRRVSSVLFEFSWNVG